LIAGEFGVSSDRFALEGLLFDEVSVGFGFGFIVFAYLEDLLGWRVGAGLRLSGSITTIH